MDLDPSWEFQAPQFVDFNNLDNATSEDKKADEFFNVDMESGELWTTALDNIGDELSNESQKYLDKGKDAADDRTTLSEQGIHDNSRDKLKPTDDKHMLSAAPSAIESESYYPSSIADAPLVPPARNRRPANLVTSWGSGNVAKVSLTKSGASKQPSKKRRRLSNAIVQSMNSPSRNNNTKLSKMAQNTLLKLTPRRHHGGSITGYKSGGTPKRLGTNSIEPRLAINMWRKKVSALSNIEEGNRPSSAPASSSSKSSKFFLTKPKPFKLSTEVRAEERKILDSKRKKDEMLKEKEIERELEKKRREEEAELLKYRQSLVHKALPIKQYRKVEIKRSDKMLTMPASPHLTRNRSKLSSI